MRTGRPRRWRRRGSPTFNIRFCVFCMHRHISACLPCNPLVEWERHPRQPPCVDSCLARLQYKPDQLLLIIRGKGRAAICHPHTHHSLADGRLKQSWAAPSGASFSPRRCCGIGQSRIEPANSSQRQRAQHAFYRPKRRSLPIHLHVTALERGRWSYLLNPFTRTWTCHRAALILE